MIDVSNEAVKNSDAPVESVDRALRLILLLRERGSLSIKEAASILKVAPSTAHRLLATLTHRDFAVQDYSRRYRLGPAMSPGDSTEVSFERLKQAADSVLPLLQREVGETVQIMALRGQNIQFLDGIEPSTMLRVAVRRGEEMPAFVSAGGKAILARMSNSEIEELFAGGLPAWPHRKLNTVNSVKRAMTRVRRDGFAISDEETEQGVSGVGVAVNDASGFPLAALTVAIPAARFDRADVGRYAAALHKAAEDIERQLSQ